FWNYVVMLGKLYGNRTLGSKVSVKNDYWYSYPGYNEIFTGYPDSKIKNNNYGEDPNKNVLEFINNQKGFKNEVAGFGHWTAFNRIFNVKKSKLHIVAGHKPINNEMGSAEIDVM